MTDITKEMKDAAYRVLKNWGVDSYDAAHEVLYQAMSARSAVAEIASSPEVVMMVKAIAALTAERDALLRRVEELELFLFPYANNKQISGISWDGKYLIGDKASISFFREMKNRGEQIDVYKSSYDQKIAAAESTTTALRQKLAEAVEALEPFARVGGYLTPDCGWTPDDEVELMFGDRSHLLCNIIAVHFIRAREIHRKVKA